MKNLLYYCSHVLLNSKYKFIINISIIFVISITMNNLSQCSYASCMNALPEIAEAKPIVSRNLLSEQSKSIITEIRDYVGPIVGQIEEQKQIIVQQQSNLQTLETELDKLQTQLDSKNQEIRQLTDSIERRWNPEGYKVQIANLKSKCERLEYSLTEVRRQLEISEKLFAEAKSDKERMYSILGDAFRNRKK